MFFHTYKIRTHHNKFLIKIINKNFKNYTIYATHPNKLRIKSVQNNQQLRNNWSVKLNVIQQIQQQHPYNWRYLSNNNNNVSVNKVKKYEDITEQIYVGPLAQRMKVVKVFSLTTSFVGLAVQPVLLDKGIELGGAPLAILFCSFAGVFTFLTPFLLHIITKNYVTEIRYNNDRDEYIATTVSMLLRKIHTKFHPNDVKIPEVPGIFTSFFAQGKPLFVDPTAFHNADHYMRIMGYDKPIDYKFKEAKGPAQLSKDKIETKY